MKAVKYVRVSSNEQNTARQSKTDLKLYIDRCSGTIPFAERQQGKKLLTDIDKKNINAIHIHSIDRLGRSAMDIQQTIDTLLKKGVNIVVEDLGLNALLKDNSINPMFKLITDLMANIAQMERDSIKKRQAEGIAIAKAKGVYKKARNRQKLSDVELLNKNVAIVNCLKSEMSLTKTAQSTGKSIPTIIKIKKILNQTKRRMSYSDEDLASIQSVEYDDFTDKEKKAYDETE